RAYLPQQDLASGTLRIIVVEGRLEGLDSSALASPRELAMSFPGRTGELLDLRELEQLVDQLSRLPSRQAQLELVPGSEVGGSRVRLKGERDKPWRVSATRNNDGDVSTGEQQMGLGLDWDSPLGLADQLNLRANRDAVTDRWRHSDSQSLFYSLPWGWWTFTYGYSQSDYRTRNEASGFPFKLDGDSRSHQFRA
ncbi:TPA: two-partner secretion system transporter TpsB1, partial [Pseudomonas aeruginosa]|nr:two-partner secretion system transporter TpsB1 [Pseudomonas aeruginosa]